MIEPGTKGAGDLVLRRMEARDLAPVIETDMLCLPRPWSEAAWREELLSPFGLLLVLEEGGVVVGHIAVKLVADELHITTLAVRPEHRHQGYARALVEGAFSRSPNARHAHLEVRPSNAAALTLYRSLGFSEVGLRRRYYGDEDAVLMSRVLGG